MTAINITLQKKLKRRWITQAVTGIQKKEEAPSGYLKIYRPGDSNFSPQPTYAYILASETNKITVSMQMLAGKPFKQINIPMFHTQQKWWTTTLHSD